MKVESITEMGTIAHEIFKGFSLIKSNGLDIYVKHNEGKIEEISCVRDTEDYFIEGADELNAVVRRYVYPFEIVEYQDCNTSIIDYFIFYKLEKNNTKHPILEKEKMLGFVVANKETKKVLKVIFSRSTQYKVSHKDSCLEYLQKNDIFKVKQFFS